MTLPPSEFHMLNAVRKAGAEGLGVGSALSLATARSLALEGLVILSDGDPKVATITAKGAAYFRRADA